MKPIVIFTKHFKELDLKDLAGAIKEAGAEGADLCVRPGFPVEPSKAAADLPAAVRLFKDQGLCVAQITLPTDFIDPKAPGVEDVFAACAKAQVPLLKLGYWSLGEEGYWPSVEKARGDLEGFARLAEKHRVKGMVHVHCGSLSMSSLATMNMVNGFDPKLIGVFADSGHQSVAGESPALALSAASEYLSSVALKDMVRENKNGKWREVVVPMGQGLVDLPGFVAAMKAEQYAGPVSIHCEYEYPLPELHAQAKRDVAFYRSLI